MIWGRANRDISFLDGLLTLCLLAPRLVAGSRDEGALEVEQVGVGGHGSHLEVDVGLLGRGAGDQLHESGLESLVDGVLVLLHLVGGSSGDLGVAGGSLADPREPGQELPAQGLADAGSGLLEDGHLGFWEGLVVVFFVSCFVCCDDESRTGLM